MNIISLEDAEKLKKYFLQKSLDLIPLIVTSVDESTIRSFQKRKGHQLHYKPLSLFRSWAYEFFSKNENVQTIVEKENFQNFRSQALQSLMDYWKNIDGGEPEFYQFNKLIDLLFKFLPLWSKLDNTSKIWIFDNTNVPLDKFTLGELSNYSHTISLGKNPRMNSVTPENYNLIQNEIKNICKDISPLIFDLYAWDKAHEPKLTFDHIELKRLTK